MSTYHPHTGKNLFLSCIDDRLSTAMAATLIQLHGGAFHPTLAGGAAAILDPSDQSTALKQIVAAYKINQINEIYLQNHTDCGAYRLAGVTFNTPEEEISRHYTDLEQAAAIVHAALKEAGANDGEVTVHVELVNAIGEPVPRIHT